MISHKKDIQQLIAKHERRLQKRKLQQAQYGLAAEPHILTEIEDIEAEIAKLKGELDALDTITHLNPYQGLAAFQEQHADLFFGREVFADHLVTRVQTRPLVALLGPSGSGKSSIAFAGVIPRLRQLSPTWCLSSFRPGPDPFKGLAAGLLPLYETGMDKTDQMVRVPKLADHLRTGELPVGEIVVTISEAHPQAKHVLLVADQLEELFTLTDDVAVQHHFLDCLLAAFDSTTGSGPTLHLFLTLRADFLGQALLYTPLRDALQDSLELLGPLEPDQLRAVVEQPAALRGVDFEPGLVDLILTDIANQPGSLPLLEFALTTLWEQQTHGTLTHAAYNELGRVEGALSRHADRVFESLSEAEQTQAGRLFLQLVQPGEATEDTRRLAYRHDLAEADWPLVQKLVDERLVVTNRDVEERETVEVAHEALIQGWGRLRIWIEADRAFLTWRKHLHFSLAQWQASQYDPGALLRGTFLQTAETWLADRGIDLGSAEWAFIETSVALRQEEAAAKAETRRQLLILEIRTTGKKDLEMAGLRGADLNGADLSGANLRRADLSGANLSETNLIRANLNGANLSRANLSGADLHWVIIDDKTQLEDKWRRVWQIVNKGAAGLNLSKADLSEANLSEANLSKANLSKANLSKANLSKADLSEADLSGANLSRANLSGINLNAANLSGANLSKANLSGANLSRANLSRTDLSGSDLVWANLSQANLIRADLSGSDLSRVDLSRANLFKANLRGADLRGTDLSGANLHGAKIDDTTQNDDRWRLVWEIINQGATGRDLSKADLSEVDLSEADLSEADLSEADLGGVNLSGANLSRANLSKANLISANLIGANLSHAKLSLADLRGADLSEANLINTNLRRANLIRTDLRRADLREADLRDAIYDNSAQWPIAFDPQAAGARLKNKQQSNDSPLA